MNSVQVTCPYCGYKEQVEMPENSSEYNHRCDRCKRIIHARQDEHCVICSYGDRECGQK